MFHFWSGLSLSSLMGLNVLGAVFPFYIFKRSNPIKIYLIGMFLRVILLGFALAWLYYLLAKLWRAGAGETPFTSSEGIPAASAQVFSSI